MNEEPTSEVSLHSSLAHHSELVQPQTKAPVFGALTRDQQRARNFQKSYPSILKVPNRMTRKEHRRAVRAIPERSAAEPSRRLRWNDLFGEPRSLKLARGFHDNYKFVTKIPDKLSTHESQASVAAVASFMSQAKLGSKIEYKALMAQYAGKPDSKAPDEKQRAAWHDAFFAEMGAQPDLRRSQRVANNPDLQRTQKLSRQAGKKATKSGAKAGKKAPHPHPAQTLADDKPAQASDTATNSDPIVID